MAQRTSKDVGCTFPYRQIHFDSQGIFGPCCQFVNRKRLFGNSSSIDEYLNSKELENLKEDLNNGVQVNECRFCWNQEKLGMRSMRQHSENDPIDSIKEVFITFGNQCNTACRICNASRSSLIEKHNKLYKSENKIENYKLMKWLNQEHLFPNGKTWYTQIIDDVENLVENLELLQISGGEPFINVHFDRLIDRLVNSGKKLPKIRITTNGSFTKEQIEKLEKFEEIQLLLSVDGLNKTFYEYLRWPLKYDDLLEKLEILKSFKTDKKCFFEFQLVMHNLNLTHLHDAAKFFIDNFQDDNRFHISFTTLNGAEWYKVQNAPTELKLAEIKKLESLEWNKHIKPAKETMINHISKDIDYTHLDMLKEHVKYTDSYRGVDTWNLLGWHPDDLIDK